jgi:rhodanese-related sulfurtransferase
MKINTKTIIFMMLLLAIKMVAANFPDNRLSIENFANLLSNSKEIILLDIRTPYEYEQGHIDDALLLNYYDKNFISKLSILDKDKHYLIYCRSGNRSKNTLQIMNEMGFKNFADLKGGIQAWIRADKKLVK